MSTPATPKLLAILVADLDLTGIGTRSRAADLFAGTPVLRRLLTRLLQVQNVHEVAILAPLAQHDRIHTLLGPEDRVTLLPLDPGRRSEGISARVKAGRAWNLSAWRGGAGQWTAFDEEFHPAAIASAAASAFSGTGADHILTVHSHAVFLDVDITSALVHHHLHKNHEMRLTYTPAAPGLSGILFRADILREMGERNVMPWQLLGYDPKTPNFDSLIREACMQVDPALSKIPNRFCVDTDRTWQLCESLATQPFSSAADLCLAAAREVAPGVTDLTRTYPWPRELQLDITSTRLTTPLGATPLAPPPRPTQDWIRWLSSQKFCDDLLVTVGNDGDPLLSGGLPDLLAAIRAAGAHSICLHTDLIDGTPQLLAAIDRGLVDIVSVPFYGHTAATYAKVAHADHFPAVMANMELLAAAVKASGGVPLVIPRLLKVRDTIGELEPFFDFWIERTGWAVIDSPTDRAGAIPFHAVVDMAPPKRRPCRRLWERMLLRADGTAIACDQDTTGNLSHGTIDTADVQQLWAALNGLRNAHAQAKWNDIIPCNSCREWHRP